IDALLQKAISANPTQNVRLLDACAAPGGKLAHWLELLGNQEKQETGLFHVKQSDGQSIPISKVELTAIDNEAPRITRIFENLERLQLPAPIVNSKLHLEIECVDATTWQAKEASDESASFDAILLD